MLIFYVLILSLPLTQHWFFGAGIGTFTVSKLIGVLCAIIALLHLATRKYSVARLPTAAVLVVIYFSVQIMSGALYSRDFSALENPISILLLLWVTVVLVDRSSRLSQVLAVTVGSVAVTSIYAIREWMGNRAYSGYRPGSVSGDANYFGVCAAAAAPLALALLLGQRSRREKLYYFGCFALILGAFSLAASRGGFVGLAVGLVLLAIDLRKFRIVVLMCLIVVPTLLLSPYSVIGRFTNPGHGDTEAVVARKVVWNAGLKMIAENPFIGIGLGRFDRVVIQYEDPSGPTVSSLAHNTYIESAAEFGIPTSLLLLGGIVAVMAGLQRILRATRRRGPPLLFESAAGLQAGVAAAVVSGFFVSAGWHRAFWFFVFLGIALIRIGKAEEATAKLDDVPEGAVGVTVAVG